MTPSFSGSEALPIPPLPRRVLALVQTIPLYSPPQPCLDTPSLRSATGAAISLGQGAGQSPAKRSSIDALDLRRGQRQAHGQGVPSPGSMCPGSKAGGDMEPADGLAHMLSALWAGHSNGSNGRQAGQQTGVAAGWLGLNDYHGIVPCSPLLL